MHGPFFANKQRDFKHFCLDLKKNLESFHRHLFTIQVTKFTTNELERLRQTNRYHGRAI